MAKQTSKLRAEVEHVYTLTDQLQVQLRVVEEMHAGVHVRINDHGEADIMTIAFIVMMESAKSAQDDLKAIMEQVKAINEAKKKLREKLHESKQSQRSVYDVEGVFMLMATLYVKQLVAEADEIQDDLDSMSEMGEMESLRLQMAMDRLSKMMSTLSNLLKKSSETSSQIVQNMK